MSSFICHDLSEKLPADLRNGVVAIGNFDGVHRGHQYVLKSAMQTAKSLNAPCYALSFEPHPRTLFKPDAPVFRLSPQPMKARLLEAFGLDGLLILPFTRDLASTSADAFVDLHLLEQAGVQHVVSGFDFHFGKDRQGSPEFLHQAGVDRGFGVTIVDAFSDESSPEKPVSSSYIRRNLGAGECELAATDLGFRWLVSGTVIKGAQLGRTLGYPTANIALPESCHLAHGIYAVRVRREEGSLHDGVASYGRRPTFDNGEALLESFLFDFEGDLYGEEIEVSLFKYLRGEEKFDSADALVVQMDKDSERARTVLRNVEPLSRLDAVLSFKPDTEPNGQA